MLLFILLLILIFCAGGVGLYGGGGYWGWSPLAILLFVLAVLLLTGNLRY